jgi:hypothetical protein
MPGVVEFGAPVASVMAKTVISTPLAAMGATSVMVRVCDAGAPSVAFVGLDSPMMTVFAALVVKLGRIVAGMFFYVSPAANVNAPSARM